MPGRFEKWFFTWLFAWLGLFDDLTDIVSLTFARTNTMGWLMKRRLRVWEEALAREEQG